MSEQLTEEAIEKYIAIYKKHYGVVLTKSEALEKGLRLIRHIKINAEYVAQKNATRNQHLD